MDQKLTTLFSKVKQPTMNPMTPPAMATRADTAEWMLRFDVDYSEGTEEFDLTDIMWCTEIINNKVCLCVSASYTEDDGYDGGFCLGRIDDVRMNSSMFGGSKRVNLSVSVHVLCSFLKLKKCKIPKRNANIFQKTALAIFFVPYLIYFIFFCVLPVYCIH
jgi:hypothetical protein